MRVALVLRVAAALYADQAGELDWTRAQIGPITAAVYQQRRAYALTAASLVVALNARTGAIEWRRLLPDEPGDVLALTAHGVVTVSGRIVRSWRLGDGALAWDAALPVGGDSVGIEVVSRGAHCVVVVLAGNAVSSFDCKTGTANEPWFAEPQDDPKLGAALAAKSATLSHLVEAQGSVIACGTTPGGAWAVAIDPFSAVPKSTSAAFVPASKAAGVALLSRSQGALPLLVTLTDATLDAYDVAAALAGSKATKLASLPLEALVGTASSAVVNPEPNGAGRILRVEASGATRLVAAATAEQAAKFNGKLLVALDDAPCGDGCAVGTLATPVVDRVFWGRLTAGRVRVAEVFAEGALAVDDAVSLDEDVHGPPTRIFPHVFEKKAEGEGLGYRAMVTTAAESVAMVAKDKVHWIRDEALASIQAVDFVDNPKVTSATDDEDAATQHCPTFKARLEMQLASVSNAVSGLATAAESLMDGEARKRRAQMANAERYGFDKLAVALTRSGRLFAIAAHTGDIVWSKWLGDTSVVTVVATRRHSDGYHAPELAVVASRADATVVTRLDAHTAATKETTHLNFKATAVLAAGVTDATGRDVLLVISDHPDRPQIALVPDAESSRKALLATAPLVHFFIITPQGVLRSFAVNTTTLDAVPRGDVVLAPDGEVLAVATAHPEETTSSKAHILGDDALLLKYLNPHLAAVCTATSETRDAPLLDPKLKASKNATSEEPPSLFMTLVDTVAAKTVARVAHPNGAGPCRAVATENWIVYSFWNAKAKRNELASLSLHEGMIDRHGLSPFKIPDQESVFAARSAPPPVALYRTFALEKPLVANLAPTLTARGIASKHIFLGIAPGQILALDRRALDPRRPLLEDSDSRAARKKVERELEEGLVPYTPFLPVKPKSVITYTKTILGLERIFATSTKLESTTLVFATGIDVHSARYTPSGGFDLLADDFNHALLLLLLLGLGTAALVLRAMANRKSLALNWA